MGNKSIRNGLAVAALGLLTLAQPAQAEQFPSYYQGTRALGMGGAFTAVADDSGALFYNPAGLRQLEGMSLDLINLEVETSKSTFDLVDDLEAAQGGTEAQAADLIRANVGKHFRERINTTPNVATSRFGFAILGQATADGDFRNMQNPVVDLTAMVDVGASASVAHSVGANLDVGATGKYVRRKAVTKTFTALDIASSQFDPFDGMNGWETDTAFDLGAMYHLRGLPFSPTVAATALNLTDLDFGPAGVIPASYNVGIALHPKVGPLGLTLAADFVDVTKNLVGDEDPKKRTNLGAEVALWDFLAVRAGVHQSYFSAGATLNVWVLKLDLATYAEELGAYGGQREDRRYIARLDFF